MDDTVRDSKMFRSVCFFVPLFVFGFYVSLVNRSLTLPPSIPTTPDLLSHLGRHVSPLLVLVVFLVDYGSGTRPHSDHTWRLGLRWTGTPPPFSPIPSTPTSPSTRCAPREFWVRSGGEPSVGGHRSDVDLILGLRTARPRRQLEG